MDSYFVAIGSAIWLGVLTSISPCPLATNIAAITYIGKRVDSPRKVLLSGLIYTLGRTFAYLVVGILVVTSALSIPDVAMFLQKNMVKFLGPILILVGLLLLDVIKVRLPGSGIGARMQSRAERYGIWGAGLLGLIFALSFCPVSAALFFGSLIPLAIEQRSSIVMPTVYGVGTALPVLAVAFVVALSTKLVGVMFNRLTSIEKWARRITAIVFIGVGIYYCLTYIFRISIFD